MSKTPPVDLVPMGIFLKPRGLKGELKVNIFNEENTALKLGSEIWLKKNEKETFSLNIEKLSFSGRKSFIKFKEFDKRESVEPLTGLTFYLPRSEFAPLQKKELYLVDLIGYSVLNENRESIGSVVDTIVLPAQNVLVVDADGVEILIPYVDAHIALFDTNNKFLIAKGIEGLLS